MKKAKLDLFVSLSRQRSIQILMGIGLLYVLLVSLEVPLVFRTVSQEGFNGFFYDGLMKPLPLDSEEELEGKDAPIRPLTNVSNYTRPDRRIREYMALSSLNFDANIVNGSGKDGLSGIQNLAKEAFVVGAKLWEEILSGKVKLASGKSSEGNQTESCPNSIMLRGSEFVHQGRILVLPCGMTLGSHITIVGKPKQAHAEKDPKIS